MKKVRRKNPLAGQSWKTRYNKGDRSPEVVKKWNSYIKEMKQKRLKAIKANPDLFTWEENKKRLKRPVETYSASYLKSLGCRDQWVMDAIAKAARKTQQDQKDKAIAQLKRAGIPTVDNWKDRPTHVRPLIQAKETR